MNWIQGFGRVIRLSAVSKNDHKICKYTTQSSKLCEQVISEQSNQVTYHSDVIPELPVGKFRRFPCLCTLSYTVFQFTY